VPTAKPNLQYLPIDEIEPSPDNPRTALDGSLGDLTELAESIKAQGVLQHLVVCPKREGRYPLVFGERRLAAAKQAGLTEVPAEIRDYDEAQRFAAMYGENFGREGLTPLQEAFAYQRALERKDRDGKKLFPQRSLAPRLGVSQSKISNYTAIFKLPEPVIARLKDGKLTITQAINLARLAKDPARVEAALRDFDDNRDVDMETAVRKQQADLERGARVAATLKELRASGARIAPDDWRDQGGKKLGDGYYELDMGVEEHASEPCHAAIVTYHGEIAYVCTEPDRHRPAEEPAPTSAAPATGAKPPVPPARQARVGGDRGASPAPDITAAPEGQPTVGQPGTPSKLVVDPPSPGPSPEELAAKERMEQARAAAEAERRERERLQRERAEQLRAAYQARTSALRVLLGGRLSRPEATRLVARFLVRLAFQDYYYYDDSFLRHALDLEDSASEVGESPVLGFAAKSDDTLLRAAVAVVAENAEDILVAGDEPDFTNSIVRLYYDFLTNTAAYQLSDLERQELNPDGDQAEAVEPSTEDAATAT
jgi:ParB family transcriptional regulator, chromosome partitioning protein